MEARNRSFQKLKPRCVSLSQVALEFRVGKATSKDVICSLEELLDTLKDITREKNALDEKLADYVFFPLSHILRESQKLPSRVLELALQCLKTLLETGWRQRVEPNLGRQLLILLSFLAGGNPAVSKGKSAPEDLAAVAFECLAGLFRSLGHSHEGRTSLTGTENIPPLGHCVTVLLEGIESGGSVTIQLSALQALSALQSSLDDREALANFFPGIVSSLTRTLQPNTQVRRTYKVLKIALDLLTEVVLSVVGDAAMTASDASAKPTPKSSTEPESPLGSSWLKATAAQVKLALANVIKLRNHERPEVRASLLRLCLVVLEQCRKSLSDSASMMVETIIALSEDEDPDSGFLGEAVLKQIASAEPRITEMLNSSLHSWLVALPRVMQSNDDTAKQKIIKQISVSFKILTELGADSNIVDSTMATNLRDSVSAALHRPSKAGATANQNAPSGSNMDILLSADQSRSTTFSPVLASNPRQQDTMNELHLLVKQLSGFESSLKMVRAIFENMRDTSGDSMLASFWLTLNILRGASSGNPTLEDLLDFGATSSLNLRSGLTEELYSFSLSRLSEGHGGQDPDWRVQALAIEGVTLQAQQLKEDFRLELVDALYPIVHLAGSSVTQLREHAVTSLNLISDACGYTNASDLIISNVDYLVNAVALKLNTFDISPQAPQVLLMMIKLSGPALLPYLDDLVDSIFAALDNFHGYPRLVELLFAVLGGIVEEGSRADALTLPSGRGINHRKPPRNSMTMDQLAVLIKTSKAKKEVEEISYSTLPDPLPTTLPTRPWKDLTKDITSSATPQEEQDEETDPESQPPPPPATAPPKPPSKTHTLLHRTALLTQHYLTHPSPTLRLQLLNLLKTATAPLCHHQLLSLPSNTETTEEDDQQDDFLPLIATLWTPLITRLYDTEPYVTIAAADTIAAFCIAAGDFVSSRIEDEWVAKLRGLCRGVRDRVFAERRRERGRWKRVRGVTAGQRTTSSSLRAIGGSGTLFVASSPPSTGGGGGGEGGLTTLSPSAAPVSQTLTARGHAHAHAHAQPHDPLAYSQPTKTWAALLHLLLTILSHVAVSRAVGDQMAEMILEYYYPLDDDDDNDDKDIVSPRGADDHTREEALGILKAWNDDLVWLVAESRKWRKKGHGTANGVVPHVEGFAFKQVEF
ncbi:MAG: hypothetical protein M1819_001334 [Sarea resinae]|nr:MAG: hypothetical protein M1819_001334 [Sarea resinae]